MAMDWTTLAVQIPIVTAFIWFASQMQKNFADALDKRDQLYEDRNAALVGAITANTAQLTELTKLICTHDAATEQVLANIQASILVEPKTQPRRKTGD